MRKTSVFVGLVAVAVTAAAAWNLNAAPPQGVAGGPPFQRGFGGPPWRGADSPIAKFAQGRIGRMLVLRSELDITPEQRQQLIAKLKPHREDVVTAVRDMHAARTALASAVTADAPNEAAIRAAAEKLGKEIGDAAVVVSGVVADARKVLTDEQVKKIQAARADSLDAVDDLFEKLLSE